MTSIISLQLLPAVLILFGGIVAMVGPAIESFAAPRANSRHNVMLLFCGLASPFAVIALLLLAVHALFD
jgi:hypothetical protein